MAKVQLRARSVLGFVLVGVAAVGCGGQRAVGDPMPPTASQMQAVAQATASIDQFSSIKANPQNALAIQGQLGALGSLAVDPSRRQALNGDGAGDLGPSAEPSPAPSRAAGPTTTARAARRRSTARSR
jgi:hypothetical protein